MDTTHDLQVFAIQPGIAVVKHGPAELGFCSLRTFTFDAKGRATITSLDLEEHQARHLYESLGAMLNTPMKRD